MFTQNVCCHLLLDQSPLASWSVLLIIIFAMSNFCYSAHDAASCVAATRSLYQTRHSVSIQRSCGCGCWCWCWCCSWCWLLIFLWYEIPKLSRIERPPFSNFWQLLCFQQSTNWRISRLCVRKYPMVCNLFIFGIDGEHTNVWLSMMVFSCRCCLRCDSSIWKMQKMQWMHLMAS